MKKELIEKLVKGMLVRKYKRGFPLKSSCYSCNNNIDGIIHRSENSIILN